MSREQAVRRLRELADDLRTHRPYPGAEYHAMVLDGISMDIVRDLMVRP